MKLFIGNYNYSSWSLRAWLTLKSCTNDFQVELIRLGRQTFLYHKMRFLETLKNLKQDYLLSIGLIFIKIILLIKVVRRSLHGHQLLMN